MFVGSLGEDRGKRSEESFACSQFASLGVTICTWLHPSLHFPFDQQGVRMHILVWED